MNAKEYVDEVLSRLTRLQANIELDSNTVLSYVNRARRLVQQLTVKYEPERYGNIYEASITPLIYYSDVVDNSYSMQNLNVYYTNLPNDLLDIFVFIIRWEKEGVIYRSEARQMTLYEMQNIVRNTWRVPTPYTPVYAYEKVLEGANFVWRAFMAGLQFDENETVFNYNPRIEVWYSRAIPHLELYNSLGLPDQELFIPPAFEELVILYAMLYCLENTHNEIIYSIVLNELTFLEGMMNIQREFIFQKQELLLPSRGEQNA